MIFTETPLAGAWIIQPEPKHDERGFFARTFCKQAFRERGLCTDFAQCSVSHNNQKALLRGMHWQVAPHAEIKLVRCTHGAIFDVIVDVQPNSPTFGQWIAQELNDENHTMLYIPEGFAHGFMTLTEAAEVFYQISTYHHAKSARCFAHDDPDVGIRWPLPVGLINDRDKNAPTLAEACA